MFFFYFFEKIEDFVEEMFKYLNLNYKREVAINGSKIDFVIKDNNNLDVLVEIKEIRNNYRDAILGAVNQIKYYRNLYEKEKFNKYAFVIILGSVNQEQKDYFAKDNIIVIDIANILYLINDNDELIERLNDILPFSIIDVSPQTIQLQRYLNYDGNVKNKLHIKIEDRYIEKIKTIKKGKGGSVEFEKIGEKIVKLLFGDYIYDWKSQVNCNNNMQRIDLIGKIKIQKGFWNTIYENYNSRYIVFEFKNYNDKITQEQIYTTNKYLYDKALRTVAILISREAINDNAKRTCEGILRNENKLILTLNENDLINMLEKRKEKGRKSISSEYMEKIFDNFLLKLEK